MSGTTINAEGISYRELNEQVRAVASSGACEVTLVNVSGHRYIGAGLGAGPLITVHGVPGNDLGAFMNGAQVVVRGNAQDGVGNTMNAGRICVHGDAGDIIGYSMRGGKIFVRGSVGYRAGIHMKAYRDRQPIVVIGGSAADYLGEYMAGGVLVVLGLNAAGSSPVGEYAGTGMHGGTIYVRGELAPHQVGAALETSRLDGRDWEGLSALLEEFAHDVEWDAPRRLKREEFIKLAPTTARPYGTLYAY